MLLIAGVLFGASFMLPREGLPAAQSPVATPAQTSTAAATLTAPPSDTPAPTATIVMPTSTPAPAPTLTPRATLIPEPTSSLVSPLPSPTIEPSVTPAVVDPNKRLVLNAISSGVDENGQPAGAGTSFQAGTPTIYVFFNYRDVPPNALLRHAWFLNGGSAYFNSQRFNQNGAGLASVQWSPRGGFKPGLYEVRLQLGGVPQFVANFEVK